MISSWRWRYCCLSTTGASRRPLQLLSLTDLSFSADELSLISEYQRFQISMGALPLCPHALGTSRACLIALDSPFPAGLASLRWFAAIHHAAIRQLLRLRHVRMCLCLGLCLMQEPSLHPRSPPATVAGSGMQKRGRASCLPNWLSSRGLDDTSLLDNPLQTPYCEGLLGSTTWQTTDLCDRWGQGLARHISKANAGLFRHTWKDKAARLFRALVILHGLLRSIDKDF